MIEFHDRVVRATYQVLLEVFKLLEKFHDSLIVVGGWVPIMIIPNVADKHIGTIDVDLAINDRALVESGSETMEEILLSNGYRHGAEPGRFMKKVNVDGQSINVPVDFFTCEPIHMPRNEFLDITGINAISAPGCELSFEIYENVHIEGALPNGKQYSTEIKTAGVVALIVMKAHAMNMRSKRKDAYDIWFCLANYPGGVDAVARAFMPHLKNNTVKTALSFLSEHFGSTNARGPMNVVVEEGTTDTDYREFLQQDAFQRVQALIGKLANDSSD